MRSLLNNKPLIVFISILTLGILVLLARGLGGLPFREGQSFVNESLNEVRSVPIQIARSMTSVPIELLIAMWVIVSVVLLLVAFLMSPEWRRRLIRIVIRVALTYWALYIVFTRYREMLAQMGVDPAALDFNDPVAASSGQAPPAFASPETLILATYIVSFILAVVLIVMGWKAYALWKEWRDPGAQSLKKIARIAQASIDDLAAGRSSTDVIMNCYYRMSDVVSDTQHLERRASMTTGEFALRLEKAGLPSGAVQRLTRLFDGVRYGAHRSNPADIHEAVTSLNEILAFCGDPA